jgi:hypothetical protein
VLQDVYTRSQITKSHRYCQTLQSLSGGLPSWYNVTRSSWGVRSIVQIVNRAEGQELVGQMARFDGNIPTLPREGALLDFGVTRYIQCVDVMHHDYDPPAALLMKNPFNGPIASTALNPRLRSPTSGPDSMLYSRCSLSQTPSMALFSA